MIDLASCSKRKTIMIISVKLIPEIAITTRDKHINQCELVLRNGEINPCEYA